jgi:hypothetical protein
MWIKARGKARENQGVVSMTAGIGRRGLGLLRRGLSRIEAAMYLGISASKFDELRSAGQVGPAKILGDRKLFDIEMLDRFFEALRDEHDDTDDDDWTVAV